MLIVMEMALAIPTSSHNSYEVLMNFSTNGNDCDDTHSTVYPNATEVCDE